ncbi:Major Facilitator Superfamily protein [Rhizobium miluonense]|uniref:Major Facilitator Superfamily protein n=2 Tax=Rhizobium/Agrobacterium group TaxID=227290 RepID=A0A1C3W8R1_9HYPH|nr:Major Facilitator Superfamily protein [Rhizobium miluonense]
MTGQTLSTLVDTQERQAGFSRHQLLLIALLAFTQFAIIMDFTIMLPLGAAVSAYAFSAGIAGILAAGFADRFDRKHLLLFFYVGFVLGTMLCATAQDYHALLLGRILTGLFGGVIGSVVLAIITDLFQVHMRASSNGW